MGSNSITKNRFVLLCFMAAMVLLLMTGCGSSASNSKTHSSNVIAQELKEAIPSDKMLLLYDGENSLLVSVSDDNVDVSARVGRNSDIADFAEAVCPLITKVADENGCVVGTISLNAYDKDVKDGTFVNWRSYDGETGTFVVEADGVLRQNTDINFIRNYFEVVTLPDEILSFLKGEWQQNGNKYSRLILDETSVNFVSEMKIGSKEHCNVSTFKYGYDDEGNLSVCNKGGQVCYSIAWDNDGLLHIKDIHKPDDEDVYSKISDNTDVPSEKVEPTIGMTEDEVLSSTWGTPEKRNVTTTTGGTREQWVYDNGYIYFTDGIVTSIQETK